MVGNTVEILIGIIGTILIPTLALLLDQKKKQAEARQRMETSVYELQMSVNTLSRDNANHFILVNNQVKELASREDRINDFFDQRFGHLDSLIADVYSSKGEILKEVEELKRRVAEYQLTIKEALDYINNSNKC